MNQPHIEGNLYCPNTDTLAETVNEYGSARWSKSYHRDRNEQETHNATLSRPSYRLIVKGESGARPVSNPRLRDAVRCPLKRKS